ncbi:hypothetical protein RND71_018509 [Anisodus tanguticus]|uniref:Uncharacterized protein n=1 Tax=Anisodus tanguticus TaxID=243964 RepID=A0AAE1S4B5_9SOLA|nr:hypothetical protein RND71_018509 [Anisodus tanguticus]
MSRDPKWRIRGGKLKKDKNKGWVLVWRGHPASNRRGQQKGVWFSIFGRGVKAIREDCPISKEDGKKVLSSILTSFPSSLPLFSKNSSTSLYSIGPSLIGKSLQFPSNDPASHGSSTVRAPFSPYGMLPQRRPTTLRACDIFARRSLPVVPSSPLAVWTGCPSLLRSFKLWIKGTNVDEWNSGRVTRSTVQRCEVQVVMITPGYALAPLTGTPEPANAHENLSRSVIHSSDRRYG